MRSFSKKLAFVLAAAMVVTSVPAAQAKAADDFSLNRTSQILYVNNGVNDKGSATLAEGLYGNVQKYDFNLKNKPSNWKDYGYKWSSSNEKVATVVSGGVTTAVGVGKATISCVITDKATGKTATTLKANVEVKANAADVIISNAAKYDGTTVEVGDVVDLNRTLVDENGNSSSKKGVYVTDATKWVAEPATGVEINQSNGKFTFTEDAVAGDYNLYCYTYQSSKYSQATATSEKVTVTLASTGVELKQTTRVKFTVTGLNGAITVEDVNIDEIVAVAQGTDKVNYLVKSVTMSDDNKSAEVEVFYAFDDGAKYEVTIKGYDMQTMVASNGAPKSVVLHSDQYNTSKRNVVVNNSTKIWATLYDANGIDVTTDALRERLTFVIKYVDSDFETSDTTLYFAEVGERAVVKAEYHTYEYDDNGEEKDAFTSASYTFVAVAKAQSGVEKIVKYATDGNIYGSTTDVKMESDVTGNKLVVRIKLVEDTDSDNLIDLSQFGQIILSEDGTETLGSANFTSLVPDVLEVYNDGTNVQLYPRKTGTGRIMVSYISSVNGYDVETAIGIVEVKVQAEPTLTYVTMDSNGIVISANPADNANTTAVENQWIRVQIAHQYGQYDDNYTNYNTPVITGSNALSKRIVDAGGVTFKTGFDGWKKGVEVDNSVFLAVLDDMDGNGVEDVSEGKSQTKASRFSFVLTVTDSKTYASKSVNFYVDARRAVDTNNDGVVDGNDMTIQLVADTSSIKNSNNNVARVWTNDNSSQYYNWNTENSKTASYAVYWVNNGAKWDEVEITGELPATEDIAAASTGYYYVINKGGKNISASDTITAGTNGSGSIYTLAFSKDATSKVDNATAITSYSDYSQVSGVNVLGAGTYEFILYEIINKDGTNRVVRKASSAITVSCDMAGSYKLASRNAVSVSVSESDAAFQQALLKCFSFTDRDGITYNSWDVAADGTVKFKNNQTRKYYVTLNAEKASARPGTVYVESVTFWEPVNYAGTEFAEYTVPVGYFVTVPQQ